MSSTASPNPCKHLSDYKLKHGLSGYESLQKCLRTGPNGRTSVEKNKSEMPRCCFCSGYQGRLYFCLICSSVSCRLSNSNHALMHARSEEGHEIAVDIQRAELFCCTCCDQIYDPDFDRIVSLKSLGGVAGIDNGANGVLSRTKKRRRLGFGEDLGLKVPNRLILGSDRRLKSCFPLGLRGLNNLGSTCFMNSVLQALLHAPPFRNYFLSDRHRGETCRRRSLDQLCLPCDIVAIFSAVFSGERTPYSPAQFLYSWWQHLENLASYAQQDAHEFFISVLDQIHEKEGKSCFPSRDEKDYQCIAHRVFSGLLRSDVTCTTCGFISTTYDPCIDISLDFNSNTSHSTDASHGSVKATENTSISTLLGCLDLFTGLEKLGSDQKLYCENCRERRESLKQMSIRKLPMVLCLHVKRFEHYPTKNIYRKIDRYLQFPFTLDMAPYLSSSIVRNRFGNRMFSFEGDELSSSSEFEIFAVVTHSGMLESGHYVTYLRLTNQWYKCDDAWITEVDEDVVRAAQCYLMFYVQKVFYVKASEDLSYLPVSPVGDAIGDTLLPVAGCC